MLTKLLDITILYCLVSFVFTIDLSTTTKSQKLYKSQIVSKSNIYSIEINRLGSTKQSQSSKCWSIPKCIIQNNQKQLFRISDKKTSSSNQLKIYQSITNLSQQQNIIQQFLLMNDSIFVVTTDNKATLISFQGKKLKQFKINFYKQENKLHDKISLLEIQKKILIISKDKMVLCNPITEQCKRLPQYQKITSFRGANIFKQQNRNYIFITTASTIFKYQITSDYKLINKKQYNSSFFGLQYASFRGLLQFQNNKIIILQQYTGVWEVVGLQQFKLNSKTLYQQFGCYQIIKSEKTQNIILSCAPSLTNFFILKIAKSKSINNSTYQPLQTIFVHQKLYQTIQINNIILSRIFTGFKIYFSSNNLNNPYPHFYQKAGSIFLHNAIEARVIVVNGKNTIFVASSQSLHKIQMMSIQPYIKCFSHKQVKQEYKLTYKYMCQDDEKVSNIQKICSKQQMLTFQATQHKQIRVGSLIVPFVLSFFGLIAICIAVYKIYNQYQSDVSQTRKRYNIQENQLTQI